MAGENKCDTKDTDLKGVEVVLTGLNKRAAETRERIWVLESKLCGDVRPVEDKAKVLKEDHASRDNRIDALQNTINDIADALSDINKTLEYFEGVI